MNEVLIKRLLGAGVLLLVLFLASLALPGPDRAIPTEPGLTVLDLAVTDPAPVSVPAPHTADPPAQLPAETGDPTADPAAESPIETRPLADAEPLEGPPQGLPEPTPAAPVQPAPEPSPPPATSAGKPSPAQPLASGPTNPPSAPDLATRFYVLAGSYASIGNARQVEAQLQSLRVPVVIVPTEVDGTILYRVRSGPFETRAQAEQVAGKLASAKIANRVVEERG